MHIYKRNFSKWFHKETKDITIEKKKAHIAWKTQPSQASYMEFKKLRAIDTRQTKHFKDRFNEKTKCNMKKNVKDFWAYVST